MLAFKEQAIKYRSLDEWFLTPQGERVAHAFAAELKKVQKMIHGKTLLQLGHCGHNSWLSLLHFQCKWIMTPYFDRHKTTIVCPMNEFPFERNSIDCVLAPLTVEALQKNKNPLDEIDRVLKSMGHVILFGINPWSLWGWSLKWGHLACFSRLNSTLMSSFSIKRILFNRGYQQRLHTSFYYIPPLKQEHLLNRLMFFNEMGKMIWPFPAGFYCLILQKHQSCLASPWLALDESEVGFEQKNTIPAVGFLTKY